MNLLTLKTLTQLPMLPYLEMSILILEALNTFKNKLDQAIALDLVNNSNHFFFFLKKKWFSKQILKPFMILEQWELGY